MNLTAQRPSVELETHDPHPYSITSARIQDLPGEVTCVLLVRSRPELLGQRRQLTRDLDRLLPLRAWLGDEHLSGGADVHRGERGERSPALWILVMGEDPDAVQCNADDQQ